jgi:dihydrolipoamide dehydrogenase
VLLTAADSLAMAEHFEALGLRGGTGGMPDIKALSQRICVLSQTRGKTRIADLTGCGVQFIHGKATFLSAHRLRITPTEGTPYDVEADAIIVASGSVPIFPPGLKPDGGRIIAPRFVSKLSDLPTSIAVVGAGVTGTEFVYAFNRLGIAVTWLVDEFGVLPPFDRATVSVLVAALDARGVVRHQGVATRSVAANEAGVTVTLRNGQSFQPEMAFIAIGRLPDVVGLNLEAAGVPPGPNRGIKVDDYGRSMVPHIYAAGDVTGLPMTANKARAQGWIAGHHAAGASVDPYRPETIISAVYTDPQVAQVGLTEDEAQERGHPIWVLRRDYEASLKAMLLDETEGFVTLVTDARDGTLLGANAVGTHAADMLAPIALGIRLGARLEDLATLFPAHPGLGELVFATARTAVEEN